VERLGVGYKAVFPREICMVVVVLLEEICYGDLRGEEIMYICYILVYRQGDAL
jgi:hypothetical protein